MGRIHPQSPTWTEDSPSSWLSWRRKRSLNPWKGNGSSKLPWWPCRSLMGHVGKAYPQPAWTLAEWPVALPGFKNIGRLWAAAWVRFSSPDQGSNEAWGFLPHPSQGSAAGNGTAGLEHGIGSSATGYLTLLLHRHGLFWCHPVEQGMQETDTFADLNFCSLCKRETTRV